MAAERRIEPELLVAHSGAIRALAHELLGDRHAAEDVLQDTFVRAIVAPPPKRESLGGWLRTVAFGLASNRRRNERRRADREARYAQEREQTVYDSEARGEILRTLIESVMTLAEPYRATILQRYFEGASPTEIAERERLPIATVASRLQRAHQMLREKLERRSLERGESSRGALHALLGLRSAPSLPSWPVIAKSIGGAVMGAKAAMTLSAGAAAVLLAWWIWPESASNATAALERTRSGGAASTSSASSGAESAAPVAPANVVAERKSATGAPEVAAVPKRDATVGPYEFEVDFVPLDEFDRPLAAAEVFAAPQGIPLNRMGTTPWDGVLHCAWRGDEPSTDLVVFAERDGYGAAPLRHVHVDSGAKRVVRMPLAKTEAAQAALVFRLVLNGESGNSVNIVLAGFNQPAFELDAQGNGVFVDPWLADSTRADWFQSGGSSSLTLSSAEGLELLGRFRGSEAVEVAGGSQSEDSAQPDAPPTALLRGQLKHADGTPAIHTHVSLACETESFREDTRTDDQGRFAFGASPVGKALLIAGGAGEALAEERLTLAPGEQTWTGKFDTNAGALHARLFDAHGKPLEGWRVEAWSAANRFVTAVTTDKEGRAEFGALDAVAHRLIARPASSSSRLGATIAANAWPSGGELALTVGESSDSGSIEFDLERANGDAASTSELRIWRVETGFGQKFEGEARDVDGKTHQHFALQHLLPGEYELEAGGVGAAWTSLGRFFVAPDAKLDLGSLRLEASAELEVAYANPEVVEQIEAGILARCAGSRVRSGKFVRRAPGKFSVPSGNVQVDWTRHALKSVGKGPEGAPVYTFEETGVDEPHDLDLRAGEQRRLELAPLPRH